MEDLPELRTDRLLLRPFRSGDIDDVYAYASDPEWARYLPVPDPYTHRDAEEFVARILLADHATRPMWAIVHRGRVSGGIDLTVYGRGTAEMGYSIARPLWGQGLTTEAVRAVIEHAFDELGLARIQAFADIRNTGSWRVMEKVGMNRVGVVHGDRLVRGERVDSVVYEVVNEGWSPPAGRSAVQSAAEGPPELRTDRLLLRPSRMADVDAVFEYGKDAEWGRYLDVPQPYTRESAQADVARAVLANPETAPIWAIVHDGLVSGGISLAVYGPGSAEMGYSLTRPLWGQGLMAEAATTVLAYGFEKLDLARIQASADIRNEASWRVMEKVGMQRTGVARSNRLHRDIRVDDVFYEALREDWSPPA